MHIPINHLRKLFDDWFSLLLQIGTDYYKPEQISLLQIEAGCYK